MSKAEHGYDEYDGQPVTHLGDGCYVKFTGYSYVFMANSHSSPTDTVEMDKTSMPRFDRFREAMEKFMEARQP